MTKVIVLTSSAPIGAEAAQAAQSALSGGDLRRLAPNAVEFPAEDASGLEDARGAMAPVRIDVNAVDGENRRKKLLIADMDSTIINVECIDEIADFAGVKPQVAAITERAMRGEIDFDGALRERVGLLKGLPEAALARTFEERIRLNPGARTLVATMNAAGAATALISGGFTYFTRRVAEAAGFQRQQANTLVLANGVLTGEVADPILGREAKLQALKDICAEREITPSDAIAIGDGANDLAMIGAAGLGVAYHAKPAVAAAAGASLRFSDLTAALFLQGYTADELAP